MLGGSSTPRSGIPASLWTDHVLSARGRYPLPWVGLAARQASQGSGLVSLPLRSCGAAVQTPPLLSLSLQSGAVSLAVWLNAAVGNACDWPGPQDVAVASARGREDSAAAEIRELEQAGTNATATTLFCRGMAVGSTPSATTLPVIYSPSPGRTSLRSCNPAWSSSFPTSTQLPSSEPSECLVFLS